VRFKRFKSFKPFKPPPSSSPASRGRKEVGDLNGAPLDMAVPAYSGKRILDTDHPE
jgi:hypothetical protein